MTAILLLLVLITVYSLGMWLVLAFRSAAIQWHWRDQVPPPPPVFAQLDAIERYTFHLGLCGTLALAALGIILALGGS